MRDESSPSLKHSLSTSLVEKKSSGSVGIATQWMTASVRPEYRPDGQPGGDLLCLIEPLVAPTDLNIRHIIESLFELRDGSLELGGGDDKSGVPAMACYVNMVCSGLLGFHGMPNSQRR